MPYPCRFAIALLPLLLFAAEPIRIDGSSTVHPISVAAAASFAAMRPEIKVDVAFSGTTSGFRLLTAGEVPISGASRPIKKEELATAEARGIQLIELPIAYDGLSVCVSRANTAITDLTVPELKQLWKSGSAIQRWSQLRSGWPDQPLHLFGAGKDSGTFDFFTEVVIGKEGAARTDQATESEDDDVLVEGLISNPNALGYFGFAYYQANKTMLRAIAIAPENGTAVEPSHESIVDGSYQPLSRPLFWYVNRAALEREEIRAFLTHVLDRSDVLAAGVGYVPLSKRGQDLTRARFDARSTGSVFCGRKGKIDVAAVLDGATAPAPASATPASTAAPLPLAAREQFARAVDDLRDHCLGLSQRALSDSTALGDLERQLKVVQAQLEALVREHGAARLLGSDR